MHFPTQPEPMESATFGALPGVWTGADAPDGDAGYFLTSPIGTLYVRRVSATVAKIYMKVANAAADADWAVIGGPNSAVGVIPVNLHAVREITTGAFINATGNGGLLATDTTPILNTINGDTDGAWRLSWASSNSDAIGFQVLLPTDRDTAKPVYFKVRAAMAGATNKPVLELDTYIDEGDTKVEDDVVKPGAATGVEGTTYATYVATIAAADIPAAGVTMSIELTPAAHTTDALYVTAMWFEYTRI